MDSVIGICGKDFVIMAASAAVNSSIMKVKGDEDKIYEMDGDKLFGVQGDEADRTHFAEYVVRNMAFHFYRTGHSLTPHGAAAWVQSEMAHAARSDPRQVCSLLGGVQNGKPELYFLDFYGAMQKIRFGAQGHAHRFILGLLDRFWRPDLTLEQAEQLLGMCVDEMKLRFLISEPRYTVKVVTAEGIQVRPPMEGAKLIPPTRPFRMD